MPPDSGTAPRAGKIAVFLPSLEGGGAERSMLNLITGFLAQGRSVDLVLCQAKGAYLDQIPTGTSVVELKASGNLQARLVLALTKTADIFALLRPVLLAKKNAPETARIRSLQQYLQTHRPDVILSALPYANLTALWTKQISGSTIPVVVSERIALATYCKAPSNFRKWRWRYLPELIRRTYPSAAAVVAVSEHAANELMENIGVRKQVIAINNPVVDDSLRTKAGKALNHPWFAADAAPVILAAGRMTEQKDFSTLIRAFATVRATREAKLVILGEGRLKPDLEQMAVDLGIRADVDMPGFVENPFQYMSRASVLVLSSEYEGLPGVLIQAMACGCAVVSTDCPGGSKEILENGKYGPLVAIGDASAMAKAILDQLDEPTPKEMLLNRAEDYSVDRAVNNYLALLDAAVTQATAQR